MKAVDLFVGAGGLSIGIAKAGFEIVFANDVDDDASITFTHNHPNVKFIKSNIADISVDKILELSKLRKGELDLLAGGPPCQGFSINAPRSEYLSNIIPPFIYILNLIYKSDSVSTFISGSHIGNPNGPYMGT